MSRTDAAYMRTYRARKKVETAENTDPVRDWPKVALDRQRIVELEAEVKHLKADLARRPPPRMPIRAASPAEERFNSRPFTPAPKK